jgi:hypothetical protein
MKKVRLVLLTLVLVAALGTTLIPGLHAQYRTCLVPCVHPMHPYDVIPCQHVCYGPYGAYPCHPMGDIVPCVHPLHPYGDYVPC